MKLLRLRSLLSLVALAFPLLAEAHPGHDGHELTWNLDHLAANPVATAACFLVLAAGEWAVWRLVRSREDGARQAESRADTRR